MRMRQELFGKEAPGHDVGSNGQSGTSLIEGVLRTTPAG